MNRHNFQCTIILPAVRQDEIAELTPIRVTQGDTRSNSLGPRVAEYAVDKHLSTHSETNTNNGAGWLKLEFDKTYFIHKVVIYYRFYTDWYDAERFWCARSVANFRACIDEENNVDVSAYQGDTKHKSCGTLQLTSGLEQSDQIYTLLCNTEGDTVKLSKTTGRIAVFEVAIIGKGESTAACRNQ